MEAVLSVVIPIYNVEAYLPECIDSVLNQDYKNVEIVLVDDGSPDRCPAICDAYAAKHANIKVVHKENGGLSDARNAGIRAATGEYITFLDSDDHWNPECSLDRIMSKVMQDKEIDVYILGCVGEYPDGTRATRSYRQQMVALSDHNTQAVYRKCVEIGDIFESACIKIIKRKMLIDNDMFFKKGILAEDNEWTFRLMRCTPKVCFLPDILFLYRAHREGSITNTASIRHVRDLITIIGLSEDYYRNHPEEISGLGEYELAHCAYLWCVALGICGGLDKANRAEAVTLLKAHQGITKYASSRKTKLSDRVCRALGIPAAASILQCYMYLMQHNIVSNKTKVK